MTALLPELSTRKHYCCYNCKPF